MQAVCEAHGVEYTVTVMKNAAQASDIGVGQGTQPRQDPRNTALGRRPFFEPTLSRDRCFSGLRNRGPRCAFCARWGGDPGGRSKWPASRSQVHELSRLVGRPVAQAAWKVTFQEFSRGLTMLQTLGNDAERERLDASDGLVPVLTVGHDAGQRRDFGQAAAVVFSLDFNR